MLIRHVARGAIVLAGLASISPAAMAAVSYGTQTVSYSGGNAQGKGSIAIQFTSAKNNSYAKPSALNGKAGYTDAFFSSASNSTQTRSSDTTSTSFANVSRSHQFAGSTAGPWTGKVRTCVNIPLKSDPCSGWTSGRA